MAAPVNANINILVNTEQATAQIRALQAQINTFNKSVVAANSAAARQQVALNKALLDAANASGMFNAKIIPTTAGIDRFSQALDKGKLSLSEYTRGAASQLPGMRRIFTREFDMITKVAEDRVKRLQTQYTALGNAQKALALQPIALDMQNMATQTAMAAQKQMIFNKMINDGSTKLLNWGKNTQWAGRQLMVGFTLPLTMFGATAAKVFMDLDKQARDFKRVYGDLFTPPAEIESNLKAIQQLGDEYTKYGVKVSDTMQVAATAAAAGMRNEKLIAGTEESLRLATIGQIDYNQALDTTISLQTAFKMSADDLAPSVDFLGAVANQTVLTIDDMTKAIPRVAPVVQGLGGDVKDLAAMLVAMREGGVSAENAANGLKSGLASLINPTNAAKEKLKELGINITAIVEANKGDLMGTVMDFGTALSKLGDFERQQALEKTFGKYQYARLGALFDNIIKKGGQAEVALTLAGKSAEELGQLSAKSLKEIEESTTAKFTGAVERLKVAIAPIGEAFLKALTPIIDIVTKIADKFNSLPDGVKNAVAIVTAVVAGIGPVVLMLVGLIANAGANIIKFIQMMRKGFARMRGDASAFEYLAGAELDAAAASQTLEGKASKLTSTLLIQEGAVRNLIDLYQRLASSAATAAGAMPTTLGGGARGGRGPRTAPPLRMATGGIVPGSGSGDKIPAMLEPGETVVTKKASQSYGPVLAAMNAGTLPGYQGGLTLPGVSVPTGLILSQGSRTAQSIQASFESLVRGLDDFSDISETASRVLKEIADNGERVTKSRFLEKMAEAGYTPRRMPSQLVGAHLTERRELSVSGETYLASKPGRGPGGKSIPAQAMLAASQDPEIRPFMREYSGLTAELSQTLNTQLQTGAAVSDFNEEWSRQGSRLLPSLEKFGGFVGDNAEDLKALSKLERLLSIRVNSRADVIETGIVTDAILVDETRKLIDDYKHAGGSIGKVALAADKAASTITQVSILMSKEQAQALVNQGKARRVETDREFRYISNSGVVLGRESKESGTWRTERVGEQLATTSGRSLTRQTVVAGRKEIGANSPAEAFAEIMDDAAKGMVVGAKRSSKVAGSAGTIVAQSAKQAYKKEMSQSRREAYNIREMQRVGMSDTQVLRQLRRLEESKARARQSEVREATRAAQLAQQNARLAAQTTTAMQQQNAGMTEQVAARGPGRMARVGRFFTGGRGAGVGMGLMSAAMMAPMIPGQAGEIASKAQPALMAISTLSMLGPLFGALANPVGIAIAAFAAVGASIWTVNKVANDAVDKGRQLVQAMVGSRESLDSMAKYFNTETSIQKLARLEASKAAGKKVSQQSVSEAQQFLQSDAGKKLIEDYNFIKENLGTGKAAQSFANQIKRAIVSGAMPVEMGSAIAAAASTELKNKDLSALVSAQIKEYIGVDGEKIKSAKGRLRIYADIFADTANIQRAIAEAGAVWDKQSWFSQVAMILTGRGTSDIVAQQLGTAVVESQQMIQEQLAANELAYQQGEISAKRFLKLNNDILISAERQGATWEGVKKKFEQAYPDSADQSDIIIQNIINPFLDQMRIGLGEATANGILNGLQSVKLDLTTITGMPLTDAKINILDPEEIRRNIDTIQGAIETLQDDLSGATDRYVAMGIQAKIDEYKKAQKDLLSMQKGAMNIAIAVQSGQLSIESLANFMQGKNTQEVMLQIGAMPDEVSLQFINLIDSLEGKGGVLDLGLKFSDEGNIEALKNLLLAVTNIKQTSIDPNKIINENTIDIINKTSDSLVKYKKDIDGLNKKQIKEKTLRFLTDGYGVTKNNVDWFLKLDDSQQKTFLTVFETLRIDRTIAQTLTPGSSGAAGIGNEAYAKLIAQAGKPVTTTDTTNNNDSGTDTGGGDKEKTALQELMDSINEKLKLYTKFDSLMKKFKGKKNAFERAIAGAGMGGGGLADKLRAFNLNESLIADILSKGAENAQKILTALEKRKGLAAKMNAKDILGRAAEKRDQIVSGGIQAMTQTQAATSARSLGASQEAIQKISEDYDLAYKFSKLPDKKKMQFILEVQKTIDAERTLEYAQDPNKALQDQIDLLRTAQDVATYANRKKIEGLQKELELVNRQISAIEELNEKDRQRIRGLERQKEMIQRQIDQYEKQNEMDQRRIDALRRQDEVRNRVADALNHDLEIMSQQEQSIRDQYQERIDALNQINQLNDHIVESQRQQLGLSQALSQGDIYAAAAAAQDMQASQGQYAREQQNVALQQGMENQIAGLTTPGGLTRQQAEEQINAIKEQSYQTSLKIRDIEDQIYNRNQLIIPLKDQQYQLDLQIRDINDLIFNRETEILNIQNAKLKPLQAQIIAEQDTLDAKNLVFETAISELELRIKQNELLDKTIKNTNALATSWQAVKKQIADANMILAQQLQSAPGMPTVGQFTSAKEYQNAVTAYNAMLEGFKKARNDAVNAAMQHGIDAMKSMSLNTGGYVKGYATGKYVVGNGGRDSVPAMLTPGEFVVRKAMVDKMGVPALNSINQGALNPGRVFAGGTPRFNETGRGYSIPKEFTPPKFTAPRFSIPENRMATGNIQRQALQASMPQYSSNTGYNNVSVNVNVPNTNASPDAIANKIAMKIDNINRRGIGNERVYKQ